MTSAKRYPIVGVFVVRAESSKRASKLGQSIRFAHAHILPSFDPFQFPFFPKCSPGRGLSSRGSGEAHRAVVREITREKSARGG